MSKRLELRVRAKELEPRFRAREPEPRVRARGLELKVRTSPGREKDLGSLKRQIILRTGKPRCSIMLGLRERVDFGFSSKTGHVFCLLICNPSFVILSL